GGSITVGAKYKIPIGALGQVELKVVDSKGGHKILLLDDVLYAPQLTFSLLSGSAAVKQDFHFTFKRGVCMFNTNQRFSIKAMITEQANLYQFAAEPTSRHQAHVAITGEPKALELLHKRGHANMRTLQDIPRHHSVLNFEKSMPPAAKSICLFTTHFLRSHTAHHYMQSSKPHEQTTHDRSYLRSIFSAWHLWMQILRCLH
ncbi:TPA: hypothetical protein N0F65_004587, partial [Lagenidium giganteum]